LQQKEILERKLPENLKLSIAKQIENNLFTKVRPDTDSKTILAFYFRSSTAPGKNIFPLSGMSTGSLPCWDEHHKRDQDDVFS
jgi:hypothetical protein